MMIDDNNDGQMIFGDLGSLKIPDIYLTGEEKRRKNLTQETCPDREWNPGPLRDRRACNRLSHIGGLGQFRGFSSTLKEISGNLDRIHTWTSFGHNYNPKPYSPV